MRPSTTFTALLSVATLAAACSRSDHTTADSAGGNVIAQMARTADTGNAASAVTPTAGGIAKVTPTDAKSVTRATEYKLTDDNFRKFLVATDSLTALRARDPQARAFLDEGINDAGVGTTVSANNAGQKHLENLPSVNNAITASGLSVPDYFVASIAIAQAERFMGNPKAAPPTPALTANAQFLNAHKAELAKLHAAK
ncbi:MAG: hypothetical protein JWN53_1067 [Gemmatimonadetes bacterium]|jgi:hypothetical protein|nr:hypothetical protein [Gemmatimonadota bacterium]